MTRNTRQLIRDIIVSLVICLILLAVFWTQSRRQNIVAQQTTSQPIYNHCPRDEYPCPGESRRPWNKEMAR